MITETLRLFPLFGIAHRMTSKDISLPTGEVIPSGSVLCFDYPAFHTSGFEHPHMFDPERWETLAPSKACYIPFGVKDNRPCPAQNVSLIWMREIARVAFKHIVIASPVNHTRSMPDRGHCLLRQRRCAMSSTAVAVLLAAMWVQELMQGAARSVVQLIFGTAMLIDARRKQLAFSYFKQPHIYS